MNKRSTPARAESANVLVVDDEADIQELVELTLARMNLATEAASDLAGARQLLANQSFDLCLTDMRLPDGDGLSLVEELAATPEAPPIAVITAYGDVDSAVRTLKAGAFDFVAKPLKAQQLRALVQQALQLGTVAQHATAAGGATQREQLIGNAEPMRRLHAQLDKIQRSQASIHIHGESGTGKELVARAIHAESSRSNGAFVPVNCGAIPDTLIESELFGYVAGAFTGATCDTDGLFAKSSGGTLFLDEVAELPLPTQVKLLRALQERAVRPVGSNDEVAVDIRIISATQTHLASEINPGRFRPDLFYRLNVIELNVPPLRQRREDLPQLTDTVLAQLARRDNAPRPYHLSEEALSRLSQYDFPGNVRELENMLERAVALADDMTIGVADLGLSAETVPLASSGGSAAPGTPTVDKPAPASEGVTGASESANDTGDATNLVDELEALERQRIEEALIACRYNKTRAAEQLGISFRALRYRLAKLGLE